MSTKPAFTLTITCNMGFEIDELKTINAKNQHEVEVYINPITTASTVRISTPHNKYEVEPASRELLMLMAGSKMLGAVYKAYAEQLADALKSNGAEPLEDVPPASEIN